MASPIDLTVLIPVRAEKPEQVEWLREAVESVETNGYPVRVHIADDGSPLPIGNIGSDGVVIDRLEKPMGVCAARNYLGWNCGTEYLMFLDADDRLVKGAIARMVEHAAPDRVVFPDLRFFGNGHAEKWHAFPQWEPKALIRGAIMPMTSIHAKAAFEKVGGFDATYEAALEDWDYNIRLMLAGICGYRIAEPLLEYRQHDAQRTSKPRAEICGMRQLLKERYSSLLKEADMPCCGQTGASGRVAPRRPQANPAAVGTGKKDRMVLIEYVGLRAGQFTEPGTYSGQKYRFSNQPGNRQRYVLAGDAEGILLKPDFRLLERDEGGDKPIETADYQPLQPMPRVVRTQAPETMPERKGQARLDDLSVVKGISAKRAEQLGNMGIQTFEALAVMRPEELAEAISGVGEKTARAWIWEARAFA